MRGKDVPPSQNFNKLIPNITLHSQKRKQLCTLASIGKWILYCCCSKPYGCYLNLTCHKFSIYHSICSPYHFICQCVQRIAVMQRKMCHSNQYPVSPEIQIESFSVEMFSLQICSLTSFWAFLSGRSVLYQIGY